MKSELPKKETRLEQQLQQSMHRLPSVTNEAHLHATILLARKEVSQKQRRRRISFIHFLGKQLSFIGWKIWSIQGLFLLSVYGLYSDFVDYLWTPLRLAKLLFCLSIAVFMTALPLLCRSVRYRMQEIETAARFSSVKLLLARLIVIGVGDITLLSGIFLFTLAKTSLPAGSAVFYLCFPFLLAGGGCLFMLGHFPPGKFLAGSFLFCSALILACSVLSGQHAFWHLQAPPAAQFMICALLAAFCAGQLRYIIRTSSYEEMQLA